MRVNGVALCIQYTVDVQLAGMVLQTRVLMGIYTPAERWKRQYPEIKEGPSLIHTELKALAA